MIKSGGTEKTYLEKIKTFLNNLISYKKPEMVIIRNNKPVMTNEQLKKYHENINKPIPKISDRNMGQLKKLREAKTAKLNKLKNEIIAKDTQRNTICETNCNIVKNDIKILNKLKDLNPNLDKLNKEIAIKEKKSQTICVEDCNTVKDTIREQFKEIKKLEPELAQKIFDELKLKDIIKDPDYEKKKEATQNGGRRRKSKISKKSKTSKKSMVSKKYNASKISKKQMGGKRSKKSKGYKRRVTRSKISKGRK